MPPQSMRALTDSSIPPVRYLPLGSPWVDLKRLLPVSARVLMVPAVGGYPGWCRRWVPGGGIPGGYWEGIPGHLAADWYCQGPTSARSRCSASARALQAPPRALRTPWLLALNSPSWSQYERDSAKYILKLVINLECRPKTVMRPVIVPVSKTGH